MVAAVSLVVVALVAAGTYALVRSDDGEAAVAAVPAVATGPTPAASDPPSPPASPNPEAAPPEVQPAAVLPDRDPPSLDEIAWTTDAPSTLRELSAAWSIPRDVLARLNRGLSLDQRIEPGTAIIVHTAALGPSASVGPPNNGRLTGGVPLPEGKAWALTEDRSRAFATTETITAILVALQAYAQRFPDAAPVQIGELSARRGGKLSGHQSHQSGLDVDIRLIRDSTGVGFDPERTWFLVKALIDGGDVTSIFLNVTEQTWLRAAAEADVGVASAAEYFSIISHEPGHTIHTHVRFVCPKDDKRCVNYSLPDAGERVKQLKSKLPTLPGAKPRGGASKLPRTRAGTKLP